MKLTLVIAALCGILSACTSSLEQVVDQRHQDRITEANSHNSVAGGAADGLGTYIAESRK